jgi:hypothetical protein
MDGIAAIRARIQQIESQFGTRSSGGVLGTSDPTTTATGTPATGTGSFAAALSNAQSTPATTATVPTSSGRLNRSGLDSVQWARDFLTKLNMPITSENVRAIAAWQQAEGTKASFNPLATTQGGLRR